MGRPVVHWELMSNPDHSRCEEKPRESVDQGMSLEERRHRDEQFQ